MTHIFKDLRWGYCEAKLNLTWFIEAMDESNITFEYNTIEIKEKFYDHINDMFEKYITKKVFHHNAGQSESEKKMIDDGVSADSIWLFLREVADDFCVRHRDIKMVYDSDD